MDEESDEDQEEINHGGKSHQEDKARQRAGDILQDSGQILSLNASQHRTPNEEGENYEAGDVFNGKTIHAVLDDMDVSNFTIGDACVALLSANTALFLRKTSQNSLRQACGLLALSISHWRFLSTCRCCFCHQVHG